MKDLVRALDRRLLGGRARRWWLRNAVLGGGWGEFLDVVAGVPRGALVLDLGAGEATLRARVPHARYIAIDRGIGHAGWDYSALDAVADAQRIPLRGASVDLVVCKQVLEHVSDPLALLTQVHRVLKPGGRVLLSTNQSWPQHQVPHDYFRFTSYGLRHLFERAQLSVDRIDPMGGAFSVLLFQFSQTLAPHLWARSARGERIVRALTLPFRALLRLAMPVVSALDRRDRSKDNTLGWYVLGRRAA